MKAWSVTRFGAPHEALALQDKTLPPPGPGEMRLQVKAAALGLPDAMMCRGSYEYRPELPFTPGQEVCGIVLDIGAGVTAGIGDRVMGVTSFFAGHGGFAEECMSMEGMMFRAPQDMSDIEAAAFVIPYQTAWIGLVERGGLKPGDTIVVLGASGGSGSAAIQLGRALGARVIAVAGGKDKTAFCIRIGADEAIDHRERDFVTEVNRLTDGRGADLIFDPVGGDSFTRSPGCLAGEGRLLAIGFASGEWGRGDTRELVTRNASVLGVFVGAYDAAQRASIHGKLLRLFEEGKIAAVVENAISFDDLPRALSALETRKVSGKRVVQLVD